MGNGCENNADHAQYTARHKKIVLSPFILILAPCFPIFSLHVKLTDLWQIEKKEEPCYLFYKLTIS